MVVPLDRHADLHGVAITLAAGSAHPGAVVLAVGIDRRLAREVNPALKAGNLVRARKSFEAFEDEWFNMEDFIRAQSLDAYVVIETGMVQIEQALLTPDQPDVAAVTGW